ncbi:MAG: sigma-54 dependent transcriptional regulator [Treponema sp.]|nr:sigma-54 dependent transcriptional regulator [Treponema sp.]MCL2265636.1 sigma-54 dependent transcriptional regulator [Treponema sp.]MCL2265647.1 sigma-54 dependent transcriptional regulator [Treponema sp.]
MPSILIIDDEPGIRSALSSILEDEKYKVFASEDALAGIETLKRQTVDLIFLDVLLPKLGGIEALEKIRDGWPLTEIVMISGHANIDMAVRAVKLGAFDFLEKPLSLEKVLTVCRNALAIKNLREENKTLKKLSNYACENIVGTSAAVRNIREMVKQSAGSDARILITGENGAGKEVIARAIHLCSARSDNPFVDVNCAAIPETLIESELFGHEKGAFTDAVSTRKGRFELAHGGTLFLDEIGDMSLSAQAKVLRVIQEQKIERVGGEKTIETDVRIIAATNQDLEKACKEGRFRQDLFFRLNVIPIHAPALRERPEDVQHLLCYFLNIMEKEITLEPDALELLTTHDWPGNVRELKNLAERIAVMHPGNTLNSEDIGKLLHKKDKKPDNNDSQKNTEGTVNLPEGIFNQSYNDAKDSFEKRFLEFHLLKNNGIISRTAEAIGIYPSNLHAKLRKYNITASGNKE